MRAARGGAAPPGDARAPRALGIAASRLGFDGRAEVGDGFALEQGELTLRAGALPGGPLPALAWRFEWRGRAARGREHAAGRPTRWSSSRAARSLLVHEAAMLPTPEQARELGIEADPEQLRREAALHTGVDAVGDARAARAASRRWCWCGCARRRSTTSRSRRSSTTRFAGRVVVAEDGDEITP